MGGRGGAFFWSKHFVLAASRTFRRKTSVLLRPHKIRMGGAGSKDMVLFSKDPSSFSQLWEVFWQKSVQVQESVEDDCMSQTLSHVSSVITMFNSFSPPWFPESVVMPWCNWSVISPLVLPQVSASINIWRTWAPGSRPGWVTTFSFLQKESPNSQYLEQSRRPTHTLDISCHKFPFFNNYMTDSSGVLINCCCFWTPNVSLHPLALCL